ncbi:MAG: permease-like cell division protein FtsX [Candidatus Saccharimonadales bacterium]
MKFNFDFKKLNPINGLEQKGSEVYMRRLITMGRILQSGGRNFLRNAWLSTAATAVMVVTLTLLLTGIIMNLALNKTVEEIASKIDVSIFLEDTIKPEQRDGLQRDFARLENVKEVRYISKLDALAIYRQQNQANPELLEAVTEEENPLPASFEVGVYDLNNIDPIIEVAQNPAYASGVESTSYDEDRQTTIQRIAGASNFIIRSSLVASLVFATISVLIIFNTIRMAVFTRSDELKIMRLIGSTNSFIRGPFLFESSIYGVVAAAVSLGIAYSGLFYLGPRISSHVNFNYVIDIFTANWFWVSLGTLAVGVAIGLISSMLAMVRYLKL